MAKHLIDKPRSDTASRLKRFLRIERQSSQHRSTQRLFQRTADRDGAKVAAFARLERTQTS